MPGPDCFFAFRHYCHDGDRTAAERAYTHARRLLERVQSLDMPAVIEHDEDLLIRLCGDIDASDPSPVLTQRERLLLQTQLAQRENVLSPYMGIRAPLFVGFSMRDPLLYILHNLVHRSTAPMAGKSFVALDEPHPFFSEAWQAEGLVVLDRSSRELEELHGQWVEQKSEDRRIWSGAEVLEAVSTGAFRRRQTNEWDQSGGRERLAEASLRNCKITAGVLNGVLLNGALLHGADLSSASLEGADLRSCQFRGANMPYAKMDGAKLNNADLGQACLVNASLQDADLTGARLSEADLISAKLKGAFGENVDFTRQDWVQIVRNSIAPSKFP